MKSKKSKTLVVNFFGGPGAGKSTNSAKLFAELKDRGINCELVREYAKDLVWEERKVEFKNQMAIAGKQIKRIDAVEGQVDVIVTDSPIILSSYYNQRYKAEFDALLIKVFNDYENFNIVLTREKAYNPKGRFQTEDEAKGIDAGVVKMLDEFKLPYTVFSVSEKSIKDLGDLVVERIKEFGF